MDSSLALWYIDSFPALRYIDSIRRYVILILFSAIWYIDSLAAVINIQI